VRRKKRWRHRRERLAKRGTLISAHVSYKEHGSAPGALAVVVARYGNWSRSGRLGVFRERFPERDGKGRGRDSARPLPRLQALTALKHTPVGTSGNCDPCGLCRLRCDAPGTAEDGLRLISADTRNVVVRAIGASLWITSESDVHGRRSVRQQSVDRRVRLHALHVRVFVGPCGVLRAERSIVVIVPHARSVILRVGVTRGRRAEKTAEVVDALAFRNVAAHRGTVVTAY